LSGGARITPASALRKAVIVAFLVGAMIALHRFAVKGQSDFDPTGMLAFGFVVLASYTFGQLVGVIKLPGIIGYIIAGFVLGPSMPGLLPESWQIPPFDRGILNHEVQRQIAPLDALAVALIALSAGGELKLETLKKGFRSVFSMMGGHAVSVFFAVAAFAMAVSGYFPAIQLDALAALGTEGRLAMAGLLASFAICTSPSVTLAVITELQAKGHFTRTVLSSVVLIDVPVAIVFSIAATIAAQVMGIGSSSESIGQYLLLHVAGSLAVGFGLGALIGIYLRYVNAEIVLFLLGIAYTGTFVAKELHMSPLLMFVAAGFACANFSRAGDKLIHEVEGLSLPVFVVFFTGAGAHLDLKLFLEVAPHAFALALVRGIAIYLGVKGGAQLSGSTPTLQKYAWTGFISQAGVALSLAALIGQRYGDPGVALGTLMVACIAINEMVGAVLFKTGLALAHEIPDHPEEDAAKPAAGTPSFHTWPNVQEVNTPFGAKISTSSEELDRHLEQLERRLVEVAAELKEKTASRFARDGDSFYKQLRREFLRHHRRIWVLAQSEEPINDTRVATGELAAVWRTAVLAHAKQVTAAADPQAFLRAVEQIDDLVDDLPSHVRAPHEPVSFAAQPEDSILRTLRRQFLKLRSILSAPTRRVALAALARYHLGGKAPAKLQSVAATLIAGERQLSQRTGQIFELILSTYQFKPILFTDRAALLKSLAEKRKNIEESFAHASLELERIVKTADYRVFDAIGGALRAVKTDVPVMNTLDLPSRTRRYTSVFDERVEALEHLRTTLPNAEKTIAMDFSLLALNLELVRLETQVSRAISEHGGELARNVDGRTHKQLLRLSENINQVLEKLEPELLEKKPGPMLAQAIRQAAEPLARAAGDAARAAAELKDQLAQEKTITPILETLLAATGSLTERYELPAERLEVSPSSLPGIVPTVEVLFRDAVITFIDTTIARELIALTRTLAEKTQPVAAALQEVERIVAFNAELAGAELDVFGEPDEIPEATRTMVRDMVIGPLKRAKARVAQLLETSDRLGPDLENNIRQSVLDELSELRALVVSGGASELKLRVIRDLAKGRALLRGARDFGTALHAIRARVLHGIVELIGEARLPEARRVLGLPEPITVLPDIRNALKARTDADKLPMVYRRLFTEHALQAGDLLTGREAELGHAYRVLSPSTELNRARALVLVGRPGVGKSALISAIIRSLGDIRVRRIVLTSPTTEEEIVSWFHAPERGVLTVLDGLEYLYTLKPGGFAPLERFVECVLKNREKSSWLVSAASEVWSCASRAVSLQAAFPEVVDLAPASVEDLSSALLARHTLSGYQLRFEQSDSLAPWLRRTFSRRLDPEGWVKEEWFRTLHAITGGMIRDALRVWLESVRRVDDETGVVHLGPIPRPPLATIAQLPESALLTLRQTMRQGWISAEQHARVFATEKLDSEAELSRLLHWGVLEKGNGDRLRIALHLESAIYRVLASRKWVPK
jgi:Kef-type K+ transport system membrane component KefB